MCVVTVKLSNVRVGVFLSGERRGGKDPKMKKCGLWIVALSKKPVVATCIE